jgi:hypothetical protein
MKEQDVFFRSADGRLRAGRSREEPVPGLLVIVTSTRTGEDHTAWTRWDKGLDWARAMRGDLEAIGAGTGTERKDVIGTCLGEDRADLCAAVSREGMRILLRRQPPGLDQLEIAGPYSLDEVRQMLDAMVAADEGEERA